MHPQEGEGTRARRTPFEMKQAPFWRRAAAAGWLDPAPGRERERQRDRRWGGVGGLLTKLRPVWETAGPILGESADSGAGT
jgi:hypothetical protein